MDAIVDLFKSSMILRGIIALLFSATACYMYLQGTQIPEGLGLVVGTIVGFFFGAAEAVAVRKSGSGEPPAPC